MEIRVQVTEIAHSYKGTYWEMTNLHMEFIQNRSQVSAQIKTHTIQNLTHHQLQLQITPITAQNQHHLANSAPDKWRIRSP
jgi:hypothetical protein